MRTDFESIQYVEVIGPRGTSAEIGFTIGLHCTAHSYPGYFDPCWGGEPSSGPEFEVSSISVTVPKVNWKVEVESESILELTYDQFCAVVGRDVAEALVNRAMDAADDTGDF